MLVMSTSFIIPVYLVVSNWLDHSATDMRAAHHGLILTLVLVQGIVVAGGAVLSSIFARKALRPIRQAHQAQAEFAANAHHQLRTPIAVMQAEVDTALLRKNQQPEDYQRVLHSFGEELRLLRATSEELLLLADGTPANNSHPASDDLVHILRLLERRYKLQVKTVISPDLYTTLSQKELTILVEALFDNAAKHTGMAPQEIIVTVTLRPDKSGVSLEYQDNGQGIVKGEDEQLFDRHFRGTRAVKAQVAGSGLGLAIVAEIVHTHSGTLRAGNLPAGGFRVAMHFPSGAKR